MAVTAYALALCALLAALLVPLFEIYHLERLRRLAIKATAFLAASRNGRI